MSGSGTRLKKESKICLVRTLSDCSYWTIFTCACTGTTEMVLLLLWRHLVSYLERDLSGDVTSPPVNMKSTLRLLPLPDTDSLKANAGKKLVGALARLSALDLVSQFTWVWVAFGDGDTLCQTADTLGSEWQSYQGYIEIMSRRLRDTVGLHEALE
jgi:nuclear pore complex protein Nup205